MKGKLGEAMTAGGKWEMVAVAEVKWAVWVK